MPLYRIGSNIIRSGGGGGCWRSPSGDWWEAGQLDTDEYASEDFAPLLIHPRPDSETGSISTTRASHRVAYYDGTNAVQYQTHIKIYGGAAPWMYHLQSGPPGASIPQPFYRGIDANADTLSYGEVVWNVDQAYSSAAPATFVVIARDQAGQELTITWTVRTSSSTADFMFISPSGNDSTGTGAIGAPWQTLARVMGTTNASTTFANRQIILRAGTYAMTAHSDDEAGVAYLDAARKPVNYRAFPNEDVTINFANAQIRFKGDDAHFGGSIDHPLVFNGSSTAAAETHGFWGDEANRVSYYWVSFTNPVSRTNNDFTNSTSIFTSTLDPNREYWSLHRCYETGRTIDPGANNNMLLFSLFSLDRSYSEFCVATASVTDENTQGMTWKDSNNLCGSRFCTSAPTGASVAGNAFVDSAQSNGTDVEIVACNVRGGRIAINGQQAATGPHRVTRCTVYASDFNEIYAIRALDSVGAGPFVSRDCVLVSRGPANVTANVTDTGAVTYDWNSDGTPGAAATPIDPATGRLRNIAAGIQYRTLYEATATPKGHVYRVT